jgi:hypothetical protein
MLDILCMPHYHYSQMPAIGRGIVNKGSKKMKQVGTGGESRKETKGNTQDSVRGAGPDGQFFTSVNDQVVKFAKADPTGERILEKAGLKPPGDHVLIQLLSDSSRSVGLDETVDLTKKGTEIFRAFKSDRIFRFTLDGNGYEWGLRNIAEPELRRIGNVRDNEVILLERDGDDLELDSDYILDLGEKGTEHLLAEKREITVYFENEPREIKRGTYKVEKLKQIFGVQEGYILEVIDEEGHLTPLKPGAKIKVKDGMRFFEQVPCGGSS